jgi:hypothetical protein
LRVRDTFVLMGGKDERLAVNAVVTHWENSGYSKIKFCKILDSSKEHTITTQWFMSFKKNKVSAQIFLACPDCLWITRIFHWGSWWGWVVIGLLNKCGSRRQLNRVTAPNCKGSCFILLSIKLIISENHWKIQFLGCCLN